MTFLNHGRNKVPPDRVPLLAKALKMDPALLMRLALDQAVGTTAAKAIVEVFGSPVSANEQGCLDEQHQLSNNSVSVQTAHSRAALRGIFG
ncbi:hypothetical protein ACSBLW_06650 [Thioclava sp. FR2]|uniref:hypothetical protein n=1 Tax=Thioclava sp. FR2 TaxID=3445780 RepID=UPI003EC06385